MGARQDVANEQERQREGLIKWIDFKVYLRVFGSFFSICVLFLLTLCSAGLSVSSNIWLAHWSDSEGGNQKYYLAIYVVLGSCNALSQGVQEVVLTFCALSASRELHKMVVNCG